MHECTVSYVRKRIESCRRDSKLVGSASTRRTRHDGNGKGNAVLKVLHVPSIRREIYGRYYQEETENPYRSGF